MLLSRTALDEVLDIIKSPNEFYRDAHQMIYTAIHDLYAIGEPADAVTLTARISRGHDPTAICCSTERRSAKMSFVPGHAAQR
jgi:replicative DNA helicase